MSILWAISPGRPAAALFQPAGRLLWKSPANHSQNRATESPDAGNKISDRFHLFGFLVSNHLQISLRSQLLELIIKNNNDDDNENDAINEDEHEDEKTFL